MNGQISGAEYEGQAELAEPNERNQIVSLTGRGTWENISIIQGFENCLKKLYPILI